MIKRKNKQGIVWVSTVVYTLIGLSVIAMLLAVVNPEIKRMKDSFVVKQTLVAMGDFDDIIPDIIKATGNRRFYELHLTRGNFKIDCATNLVEWKLEDSNYAASEPGSEYQTGNIVVFTEQIAEKAYSVTLTIDYSHLDMTCGETEQEAELVLQPASIPYKLFVENKGTGEDGKQRINIMHV